MKIKKVYVVIFSLLVCGYLFSCKKYLEEKSNKRLVVPESVEDLQGIFDGDYLMNSRTPGYGEASTDDYFATPANYSSFYDFDRQSYTWEVKSYNFPNDWANSYLVIWNANYALEKIDLVARTNQNAGKWDNVKGSALFYRGYYFLNLAWDFCKAYDAGTAMQDLGIVLRTGSDLNVGSVRSNVEGTYNQIIVDLKQAGNYLPANPIHPMRPSKAAAYGALARAYLSMRKYDSAYRYANLALQIKSDLLDYNSPEVDGAGFTPFQPFNKEIVFYTTQSGIYSTTAPPFCSIDTVLYSSYEGNDKRKMVFFRPFNGYYRFKGNYTADNNTLFSGIATDELMLTRAECLARMDRIPEAMSELNTLLIKRWNTGTFIPFTATNQPEAMDIILRERRKELLMRCLRWIDIKRLNKEGRNIIPKRVVGNVTYLLPPNDKRYALPLPQDIISITGMEQN